MKKIISVFLTVLMVIGSFAGALTVSAEEANLLADISVDDFGTKDTTLNDGFEFAEYTNTYGKAFQVKASYYTTFYLKLPSLEQGAEYQISFKYDNHTIDGTSASIRKVSIATEEDLKSVDAGGGSLPSTVQTIGSNLELDKDDYTGLSATFTAKETEAHYLYFETNYAYWMYLCDFKLTKIPTYDVTVTGGTADKTSVKEGGTVTLTATPTEAQTFNYWEVTSGNATLSDEFSATATFTMPAEAVTVKAVYTENLWGAIDTTWCGTVDTTLNDGFGFTEYSNTALDDAIAVNKCWHSTFYVKLPSNLKTNTDYELTFNYDNSIQTSASKITRIDIITEEGLKSADADGYGTTTFKNLATNIALDKGGWTEFTADFTTGDTETQYYLYFTTGYCYTLRLGGFNLCEITKNPITVENGTADITSAKKGKEITITANDPDTGMIFDRWDVVSGSVTLADPYSATTTFTMSDSAVSVKAVYKEYGAKIAYVNTDGTPYADAANLNAATAEITENDNGTNTVTLAFDSMDDLCSFLGWYNGDTFLGKDLSYTYDPEETDISKITAKIMCRNVLSGAAGFEGYANDTNMRVEPIATGVAPYSDKWGLNSGTYETEDIGFYIKTTGEKNTTYFTDVGYDRETGTYYEAADMKTAKYLATPHSGNSMLEISACYRTFVRKMDGLKANTSYTISFYVMNPDEYNFLSSAVVMDTYTEKNSNLKVMSDRMVSNNTATVYGFYEAERVEPLWETNVTIKDKSSVRNWQKVSFSFTTGDNTDSMYLYLSARTKNNWWNRCAIYVDDLVCYENVIANAGNAIRAETSALPQALRYKFAVSNEYLNSYEGYSFEKMEIMAIPTDYLGNEDLIANKTYTYDEETKTPISAIVTEANYQYKDGDTENTYVTAALYNIGKNSSSNEINYSKFGMDFSVRPYIVYTGENGEELTVYGNTVSVSVFDVMYAIRDAATSTSDLTVVNGILDIADAKAAYTDWQPADGWNIVNENAPTEYDYSFAVVGDIQYTTQYYPDDLAATYDWLINNKDGKKIQYVFGTGDITNGSTQTEFTNIDNQLLRLKDAGIAQSVIRGNHDRIAPYDSNITTDKYSYGGKKFESYDGTMKTYYRIITISGIKYMMLTLDYFPSKAEVTWAKEKVDANSDCNVIVSTHGYLNSNMTLIQDEKVYDVYDRVDSEGNAIGGVAGQYIYDNLIVPCSNIVMVICGHEFSYGPEYNTLVREDGSTAVQLLINFQQEEYLDLRSYGMISMLYFSNGGETVTVEWFSSIKNEYYMDKYQFTFDLTVIK